MDDTIERVARAICVAERMNEDDPLGGWLHWREAACAAIKAMSEPVVRVRHVKRGSTYRLIGSAFLQTDIPLSDMDEVIVYVSECEEQNLWARRACEFEDGRFEVIDTTLTQEPAGAAP